MNAQSVEWVLVVRYGKSAHRATYGRLGGSKYTKDYIQLYKNSSFLDDLEMAFPAIAGGSGALKLTYKWPSGSTEGKLFLRSADRPHLAWDTARAPAPWRMHSHPTATSVETIRGDPSLTDEAEADLEHDRLFSSDFGQPFLIAVKLRSEAETLHLRVLIENPESSFAWADLGSAPLRIQELAAATSDQKALAWELFPIGQSPELYFDPGRKANSWANAPVDATERAGDEELSLNGQGIVRNFNVDSDSIAEGLDQSGDEVSQYEQLLKSGIYEVSDSSATVKTRGSAQRVFSKEVKSNYGWKCALTGIISEQFLVGSHIVPWSVDEKIRLDPSNGICLSVLVDRAFENGFIIIQDDLTVTVNWEKVGEDGELKRLLADHDNTKLNAPKCHPPKIDYLKRRRNL